MEYWGGNAGEAMLEKGDAYDWPVDLKIVIRPHPFVST